MYENGFILSTKTLSANALKRKASFIAQYNEISKPTDTDKGTQMGGTHVSSRARPDFCILCNKRHSPISCPKVNPVDQDEIEPEVNNPEGVNIPISKCKDCTITSRKSNLSEDGNSMVSTITRALCSVHKQPTASPSTAHPPTTSPPTAYPPTASPLPELSVPWSCILNIKYYISYIYTSLPSDGFK